jgi:alpha-L-fucosidase 2
MREGIASLRYEVGGTSETGELKVTLGLDSAHPNSQHQDADGITWLEGRAPAHVVPHYWAEEPAVVYEASAGLYFAVGLAVRADGGVVHATGEGSLRVEGARSVTLFVAAATGYKGHHGARQPLKEMAALAVRMLLESAEDAGLRQRVELATDLVVRESTSPPATA